MCSGDDHGHDHHTEAAAAAPRPIEGDAVDPIALDTVDEVVITTLVDNSYDGLMADMPPAKRTAMGRVPPVPAPHFEGGTTVAGLVAEHGFSALVTVRRGERSHTILFDTGVSPTGMAEQHGAARRGRGGDRGGGAEPRPLRPCRRLPRAVAPATARRPSPHPPPPRVEPPARRLPRPARVGAAHPATQLAGGRGVRGDRATPAVAAARRQRADHRRGRPHHRLRAGHAVPRGRARRPVGARSADPRRPGARGARAGQGPRGADRLRPRRGGQHLSLRHAAHRGRPAATACSAAST